MLELPAVSVPLFGKAVPTATFPNCMVDGQAASWPAAKPFPDNATASFASTASLTSERPPLALPGAVGENVTASVMLCPAGITAGSAGLAPRLNPVPVTAACVTAAPVVVEVLVTTTE